MSAATNLPLPEYRPMERDIDIEKIAEAVEERRQQDVAARAEQVEDVAEVVVDEAPEAPEAAPVVDQVADQVAKQMRKVKVDGEEFEVAEDDLVASYQKQATATKRLQEADRILADVKAQAAQVAAQTPAPVEADRATRVKEYHDALLTGDMETANKLFDEVMMAGRREPIPDVSTIIQQATPVIKQQLSNESALERFKTDYKDVMDDPDLLAMADFKLRQFEAEGKPYAEALISAGNAVREKFKAPAPSTDPVNPPTTTRAEKLGKKAEITQIPTANSKATSNAERELSTSEIIAAERARRGLD